MKIGIVGAMEMEVNQLVSRLEQKSSEQIGRFVFHTGTLLGKQVVVAKCGIGKVNSAVCAQIMILKFQPSVVINTGVAGAVDPRLDVGDLVLATDVVQHDMDTTPLGEPRGYLDLLDTVHIACDKQVLETLERAAQSIDGLHFSKGTVASGDQFINSAEKKQWLAEEFGAHCAEMEGASVGHVCALNHIPFGVVRAISDNADGSSHVVFTTFAQMAADISTKLMLHFIEHY